MLLCQSAGLWLAIGVLAALLSGCVAWSWLGGAVLSGYVHGYYHRQPAQLLSSGIRQLKKVQDTMSMKSEEVINSDPPDKQGGMRGY